MEMELVLSSVKLDASVRPYSPTRTPASDISPDTNPVHATQSTHPVPTQAPNLRLAFTFDVRQCVNALCHNDSILWIMVRNSMIFLTNERQLLGTNLEGSPVALYVPSKGTVLYVVGCYGGSFYYLTRSDTSTHPYPTLWKQKVELSHNMTAAGEKLVLCHTDHLGVYSCDRGQPLFQIAFPGVLPKSLLCDVLGRRVLVQVGERLMLFSLDNPHQQPSRSHKCANICAMCSDETGRLVYLWRGNRTYVVMTVSGESVKLFFPD